MTESTPVYLIETIEDLEHVAAKFQESSRIAVDIESDSFYTYYPKVCLIQISTEDEDFIIDPLAVKDMSPLAPIFRDPVIEKVFHAAEYDIQCLKHDYGFEICNLFDTMAASRILGVRELGLAALISKHFGIKLSKKLQRADWGKRPLSEEQIEYARSDTHFLLALRDILHKQLEEKDRLRDAKDAFGRLEEIEPVERPFNPDDFWRLHGAKSLSGQSRAVLKEIYYYRERMSAIMDKAPFRVLPEPLMVRLADKLPTDTASLEQVPGMTPYLLKRFGEELLQVIEKGLKEPPIDSPPERPRRPPPDGSTMKRYQALREWRKKKAEECEVDSIVILTTNEIRCLAQAPLADGEPHSWLASALSERKIELYGPELLEILRIQAAPAQSPARKRKRR